MVNSFNPDPDLCYFCDNENYEKKYFKKVFLTKHLEKKHIHIDGIRHVQNQYKTLEVNINRCKECYDAHKKTLLLYINIFKPIAILQNAIGKVIHPGIVPFLIIIGLVFLFIEFNEYLINNYNTLLKNKFLTTENTANTISVILAILLFITIFFLARRESYIKIKFSRKRTIHPTNSVLRGHRDVFHYIIQGYDVGKPSQRMD